MDITVTLTTVETAKLLTCLWKLRGDDKARAYPLIIKLENAQRDAYANKVFGATNG